MSVELEYIEPQELTDTDIKWLVAGCKNSYDGVTPLEQVQAAVLGDIGIYRISGDAEGVVVIGPAANMEHTATITALGGRGLIKNFDAVHEAILAVAAGAGMRRVNGYVMRAGLAALYQRRTKAKLVPMFVEDVI